MINAPFKVLKKLWRRVSGVEPRELFSQLTNTQNELTNTQNELTNTQNELTNTQNELPNTQNERQNRLHPFVIEALSLVAPALPTKTVAPKEYDYIKSEFTKFGSDKDTRHSYGGVYLKLLEKKTNPKILEIGVGSLNDYPYAGLPAGGGLKAFRKAIPSSHIIGLDIDPEAIATINEEGFQGFIVDQTSEQSLQAIKKKLNQLTKFDLIIDDGFHDPHANVRTLLAFYELLDEGGTYVIEDVHESLIDFWKIISSLLPGELEVLDLRSIRPGVDDNIMVIIKRN